MSSFPPNEAASSSWYEKFCSLEKLTHESHILHGLPSIGLSHKIALEKTLPIVVLPTP